MAAVNGSHATKSSAGKHASSSSSCQQNGTHSNGPIMKPQISIEEAPPSNNQRPSHRPTPSDSGSPVQFYIPSPGSRRHPRKSNGAHLKAPPKAKKFNSLPPGVSMMANRVSSSSCGTPESDSCSSDGRQSAELNGGESPKYEAGVNQISKRRMVRSDSLDSELYLNSTTDDDSSVETDASPELGLRSTFNPRPDSSLAEGEDDVFQDGGLDICAEADTKLVDWACNVFVPTCRTLLGHCNEEKIGTEVIQSDLRNLSNNISFFCTEHQRMSRHFLKPLPGAVVGKGIPQSRSTNSFPKLTKCESTEAATISTSLLPGDTDSSGYNSSSQDSLEDRSYAVKVLRSISVSLIDPLMKGAAAKGFSPELFKSIVVALQKISWRVEACLSFNNCTPSDGKGKGFEIHSLIFDPDQTEKVREMMIKALPPEEPKLQSAVAEGSRHNSVSAGAGGRAAGSRKSSEPVINSRMPEWYVPARKKTSLEITPNGRPSGTVLAPDELPQVLKDFQEVTQKHENAAAHSDKGPSERTTPLVVIHRARTTSSVVEGGGSSPRKSKGLSHYGSTPAIDEDDTDYFRPRAYRRTTISLTRKEVHRLGLTVAKRIDESILDEMQAQGESPVPSGAEPGTPAATAEIEFSRSVQLPSSSESSQPLQDEASELKMEKVQGRLHAKLTKEFKRIRSRSLGDTLDQDDPGSESPGEQDTLAVPTSPHQAGLSERASETPSSLPPSPSSPLSPTNITYTPIYGRTSSDATGTTAVSDWVFVQQQQQQQPNGSGSESPKPKEKKSKKKHEKKPVDKSLSTSGRFAHGLIKSIRRGTGTKTSLSRSMGSAELLSSNMRERPESPIERPVSALGSVRTSSRSVGKNEERADTLPPKSKINTLARLVRRSKGGKTSKSFGKADAKGSFSKWTQQDFRASSIFTESIETYSKVVTKPLQIESEEQLLVSVDMAGKLTKTKSQRRKSISKEAANAWFEITITTNMKQFGRHHYTILRPFSEFQQLYDAMAASHVGPGYQLPERPDKKGQGKLQGQQMEELLRCIASNTDMRASPPFVSFLMPDDAFGTFHETDSEVSFELLMTFYTPDTYLGPPGSSQAVQVVSAEDVPHTPSPSGSRKHSTLPKRGSLHLLKKDGKEDPSTFVIREEGRDALIIACQDERYVVVAGTFEKLVEQLACEEKPDPRFVSTFLLGYRHFAPAIDFLSILLRRFHMTVAPDATEEEIAYAEKWRYVIQLRVLDILSYWMKKCWPDFCRNPPTLEKVQEFVEFLKESDDANFQLAGQNLQKTVQEKQQTASPQYTLCPPSTSPTSSLPPSTPSSPAFVLPDSASMTSSSRHPSTSGTSVDMDTLTAIQLARQLTLIELELVRAIDIHELVVYSWEPNTPENKPYRKNLDAFISRFNKVSYWVASEICSIQDAKLRGALIEKFIEMAKHCHEYKNFNTTISVVSGLSLTAVKRLKRSWEHVGEKPTKAFHKLQQILSPTTNHTNYRRALTGVQRRDPCIPYFGVFMRDLTFFNDGNRKKLKNGLYNFSKLRTMVLKFEELRRYQRSKYFFPPEDKTREFCRNLWCMSESDLYDASLSVEPRAPPQHCPETSV